MINNLLLRFGLVDRPVRILYEFSGVTVGLVHILLPFMIFPILSTLQPGSDAGGERRRPGGAGLDDLPAGGLPPVQGVIAGSQLVFALAISAVRDTRSARRRTGAGPRRADLHRRRRARLAERRGRLYVLLVLALVAIALFSMLLRAQTGTRRATWGVRPVTSRSSVGRIALFGFLLLGLAFIVLPIVIVVVNSFNASPFGLWPPPGFSTRWYANLFQAAGFGAPTIKSLEVALVSTAGSLLIGTLAGLGIARYRFIGRSAIQGFVAAPLIVPKVAIGFAAFILFLKLDWYGDFHTVVLAHIVITLPFVVTLVVAGLARVDRTLEDAAMDLGAVPRQVIWRATLPQMRGALAAAAAFSFIISFDELDATIFIVGQTDNTLPVSMFIYMEKYQDPTLAALSTLLIGAALILGLGIAVLMARIGGLRALGAAAEPDPAAAPEQGR